MASWSLRTSNPSHFRTSISGLAKMSKLKEAVVIPVPDKSTTKKRKSTEEGPKKSKKQKTAEVGAALVLCRLEI